MPKRPPVKTGETEGVELGDPVHRNIRRVATGKRGMVASAHHRATEAGVRILREGGNAVDAAVATAFALGVCEPQASGLGGQTMMLVYHAASRKKVALDGSSRAPNRAAPGSVDEATRRRGYCASTVPSTPATLDYALRRFGTMKLDQVLRPAIELAEHGFEFSELQHALTKRERRYLKKFPSAQVFLLTSKFKVPPVGHMLKQPALAQTLRRIARLGVKTFYTGRIARIIHDDMVKNGGLLRRDDLAQVPWPVERRPLSGAFSSVRLFTMPPPGAGGTLIEMLNILTRMKRAEYDPSTPEGAVMLAHVIRQAFMDRRDRPYNPNYFSQVEERRMLSEEYARRVAKALKKRVKTAGETTHLSVMDKQGNAVALTQSIENVFGSCAMSPELGFLYNNYMNAFEYTDIGHPYYLRPNAAPWASVAPTLIFRGQRPWLAIGSPGSERITPSIVQVLLRLFKGQSPLEAVDGPRLHCSLTGKVSLEAARMRDDIPAALKSHFFEVDERDPYSFYLGCVQMVMFEKGMFTGVADPRRDGSAGGPTG